MKIILKNNRKTLKYLEKLPSIYLVARWAHWGYREFKFSKKWTLPYYHPMVWNYNDHNGLADQYELTDIYDTTTGSIHGWTFNEAEAVRSCKLLEEHDNRQLNIT